jgi:MFS transporter, AAHS family, 4-hydroxybenzoate transporter
MQDDRLYDVRVEAIVDAMPLSSFQIATIALCACVAMFDGFDAQVIAFAAPVIAKAWSLDVSLFGRTFAAGLLGLMIGALVLSAIADRVGRKPLIVFSTLIFGVGSLVTVLSGNIDQLIIYRFLTGLGLGGAMPNIIALTSEYSPKRKRAFVVTVMFCGFPMGAIVGGLTSAFIIPAYGWKSVFLAGGVLPLLLLPALLIWLPESIRFLAAGNQTDRVTKLLLRIDPAAELAPSQAKRPDADPVKRPGVLSLFADRRLGGTLLLWIAFLCNLLILYFLINWLPAVLQRAGVPLERAIIATVLFNAGGVVGGLTISWLVDRFGPRAILTSAFLATTVLVAAIGAGWASIGPMLAVVAASGFCAMGVQFGMNSFAADYYPTALRSTGVGAALGVGRIGSIVGPLVGGVLLGMNLDTDSLFHLAAIPALIAAGAIFLADRAKKDLGGSAPIPVEI